MIMSASIMGQETERDRQHDRRRQIRDRLLCALEDAGRAMSPHELASVTGLGAASVTIAATNSPMYFVTTTIRKTVAYIDLHPHLKVRLPGLTETIKAIDAYKRRIARSKP